MDTKTIASTIRSLVDWDQFFGAIQTINDDSDINDRHNRHDKGALIELLLQRCSGDKLVRVNQKGYDHLFGDIKIELKSQTGKTSSFLMTGKGKDKKGRKGSIPKTGNIQLMNTMGQKSDRELHQTFEYLVLVDAFAAAVVHHSVATKYAKFTSDQLVAQIPINEVEFIVKPGDYTTITKAPSVPYTKAKEAAMLSFLDNISG